MARRRTAYVCQECGYQSARWHGKCPSCDTWDALVEETIEPSHAVAMRGWQPPTVNSAGPAPITDDDGAGALEDRLLTANNELDRVLGGGIVPGSLVLLGGDPGIGKSTLLLQVAAAIAKQARCLYVSGEESVAQIRARARRLGALHDNLYLAAATDVGTIEQYLIEVAPAMAVIDSIQTVFDPALGNAPGSVAQVRECAARFLRLAKSTGIALFLVGHVTKDGDVAGPRTLEHAADAVLYFEGDRHHLYRIVRAVKNRFGSTNEIGLFEMTAGGLREVGSPSEAFLAERPENESGSVVVAGVEGSRSLLVEVQALAVPSAFPQPRRTASGLEPSRIAFILAVLDRRAGLRIGTHDTYLKVSGGLRLAEPAADLGIALAVASSYRDCPAAADTAVFGEVGLSGELRSVNRVEQRLHEAARLGFKRCILPAGNAKALANGACPAHLELIGASHIREALAVMLY